MQTLTKVFQIALIALMLGGCSTYYEYYQADRYEGGYYDDDVVYGDDESDEDDLWWPYYSTVLHPIYSSYYDPWYSPGFYYGVTYYPRNYYRGYSSNYGRYRRHFDYSPYRYSWWDNYYNWSSPRYSHNHYGQRRGNNARTSSEYGGAEWRHGYRDRYSYGNPRYGSARNELERMTALSGGRRSRSGHDGDQTRYDAPNSHQGNMDARRTEGGTMNPNGYRTTSRNQLGRVYNPFDNAPAQNSSYQNQNRSESGRWQNRGNGNNDRRENDSSVQHRQETPSQPRWDQSNRPANNDRYDHARVRTPDPDVNADVYQPAAEVQRARSSSWRESSTRTSESSYDRSYEHEVPAQAQHFERSERAQEQPTRFERQETYQAPESSYQRSRQEIDTSRWENSRPSDSSSRSNDFSESRSETPSFPREQSTPEPERPAPSNDSNQTARGQLEGFMQ